MIETTSPAACRSADHPASNADRASRYLARLDAHLRTLGDNTARRTWLARQQSGWEHRYRRFIATAGASEPTADDADPPQAADFLATITGLAARRYALERAPRDPLARALRSLLVAADQCCPTIIGRAHLLHRLGLETGSGITMSDTFMELKSAAAELQAAIAGAEASIASPPLSAGRADTITCCRE